MKNITVIGSGTMGNGIAHVFAMNGHQVRLVDISQEALAKGMATIDKNLNRMVSDMRTGAISEVLVAGGRSFDEILHQASADADLVFLGMASPFNDFRAYYENLQQRITGLPTTVFVLAAEDLAFGEVLLAEEAPGEE